MYPVFLELVNDIKYEKKAANRRQCITMSEAAP
jgi:hypothetical protein